MFTLWPCRTYFTLFTLWASRTSSMNTCIYIIYYPVTCCSNSYNRSMPISTCRTNRTYISFRTSISFKSLWASWTYFASKTCRTCRTC
nr:MAG TPA: hypothetical protein [Bacteriophage sp.]